METDREQVFRALHDIAVAIGGVLEPVELARLVVDRALDLLDADAVGIYACDESAQVLEAVYSSDAVDNFPEPAIAVGAGAAGQALLRGEPIIVDDYANWPHAGAWAAARKVQSALAVPLQVGERCTGAMSVRSYALRTWTTDDVHTLRLLATQIAPILEAARLYDRTRAAHQRAEAAIKLRDDVLAGVSHDLAGPLTRIRLYAELIQSELPTLEPHGASAVAQLTAWSERIVAATTTMKTIMQELVDVARLQMGQPLQLDLRPLDLVGLARRIIDEQRADGRTVTLRSSVDEIIGWWDEARLSRVLSNMLENAFNYSRGDAVDVSVEPDAHAAVLQVRDRGVGIPAEDLPRVFDSYYRGSNVVDGTTGSGLGLAVAQQIAHLHRGSIDIDSELGVGTVVRLRLPYGRLLDTANE
jgi:signal transduction histidine kinase